MAVRKKAPENPFAPSPKDEPVPSEEELAGPTPDADAPVEKVRRGRKPSVLGPKASALEKAKGVYERAVVRRARVSSLDEAVAKAKEAYDAAEAEFQDALNELTGNVAVAEETEELAVEVSEAAEAE